MVLFVPGVLLALRGQAADDLSRWMKSLAFSLKWGEGVFSMPFRFFHEFHVILQIESFATNGVNSSNTSSVIAMTYSTGYSCYTGYSGFAERINLDSTMAATAFAKHQSAGEVWKTTSYSLLGATHSGYFPGRPAVRTKVTRMMHCKEHESDK